MALHALLLWALTNWYVSKPVKQPQPKPVINAKLLFMPKPAPPVKVEIEPPEEEITPEPETPEPEHVEQKEVSETQANIKPVASENTPQSTPLVTETEQPKPKAQATLQVADGQASYNPYAAMQSLIEQDNQQMFDSVKISDQPQPSIKSINSSDDPPVKELYESAYQVGPNIRVINYNGKCVQIERKYNINGFSYESWSGVSGNCGQDDAMKKQFQLSMDKFTKPKKLK